MGSHLETCHGLSTLPCLHLWAPKVLLGGTSSISITTDSHNTDTQPGRGWIWRGHWQKLSRKMAHICVPHPGGGTCLQQVLQHRLEPRNHKLM